MKLFPLTVVLLVALPSWASTPSSHEFIQKLDKDQDNTLEIAEINQAAGARFDAIDTAHNGSIDKNGISALKLSRTDLSQLHLDSGKLSREEYLKLFQNLFTAADKDHDGSLDTRELDSAQGRRLKKLLE